MMDYEKQMKAIKEAVKKLPDTEIGDSLKTKTERKHGLKCDIAYQVFDQGMAMYKDGSMSWDAMVKDLKETLDGLGKMKDKEIEAYMEDDEEDED